MKINQSFILITVLVLNLSSLQAQYTKKMEINTRGGYHFNFSKELVADSKNNVEIGKNETIGAYLDFWYNLNRKISLGLNMSSFSTEEILTSELINQAIYDDTYFGGGLGFKYNYIDKKKLKLYIKANYSFIFHTYQLNNYYYLQSSDGSGQEIFILQYYNEDIDQDDNDATSSGAEINLGLKTYFKNSLGLLTEIGYFNNGLNNGLSLSLGFFYDFKN